MQFEISGIWSVELNQETSSELQVWGISQPDSIHCEERKAPSHAASVRPARDKSADLKEVSLPCIINCDGSAWGERQENENRWGINTQWINVLPHINVNTGYSLSNGHFNWWRDIWRWPSCSKESCDSSDRAPALLEERVGLVMIRTVTGVKLLTGAWEPDIWIMWESASVNQASHRKLYK